MAYKKRKHSKSGFEKYCHTQLKSVKSASHSSTRAKAALRYQTCLTKKHGIKTGAGKIKVKKEKK